MQHRPATPAFVWAVVLVIGGQFLSIFLLTDYQAAGMLGLAMTGLGIIAALIGVLRLAIGIDYLTFRELEREAGRDFVLDPTSELTEDQQRTAARQGIRAVSHEARMARIRAAAAASTEASVGRSTEGESSD